MRLVWLRRPVGVGCRNFFCEDGEPDIFQLRAGVAVRPVPEPGGTAVGVGAQIRGYVLHVVGAAVLDPEFCRQGGRNFEVVRLVVVAVDVGEREDDIRNRRRSPVQLILGHRIEFAVIAVAVQEPAVRTPERLAELPGLADARIDGIELVVAVVGVEPDRHHGVELFEMGNLLAEVRLVALVAERAGDPELLSGKNKRRSIHRVDDGVAHQGLEGVSVVLLVVRGVVQQDEALAVSAAAAFENAAVVVRGAGAREREHDVFVEDVEVPVRAVGHRAAVERFRHEDEVPLPGARLVDDVFPELRGQALAEVRSESVDAFVCLRGQVGTGRDARLLEPVERVFGEVFPDVLRDRVEVRAVEIEEVALAVVVAVILRVKAHERRVVAEEDVAHIAPFSEVPAIGSDRDVGRARRAGAVVAGLGIEAGFLVSDFIRGISAEQRHADGGNLRVRGGVVERRVEHHFHAFDVRRAHESLECGHRRLAGVSDRHQRVDLKKVFHRIRAAGIICLTLHADRMDRLEPQPVAAEVFHVVEVPAVVGIVRGVGCVEQILERAAVRKIIARVARRVVAGLDGQHVDLVKVDVPGIHGRDDKRVIAAVGGKVGIPAPGVVAGNFPSRGQPVGAGLCCVERERVAPSARVGHREGGKVVVVTHGRIVAIRRLDAVLDAVAIRVELRAVAPVQVGEHLDLGHIGLPRSERHGDRPRIPGDLVHKKMRGRVVGVDPVHREDRISDRPVGEREDLAWRACLVVGEFFLVVRGVPEADFVFDRPADRNVLEQCRCGGNPPHWSACHALAALVVALRMIVGTERDLGCSRADSQRTGRIGSVGRVIHRPAVRPFGGRGVGVGDISELGPELHAVAVDNPVVRMEHPCRAVADGVGGGGGSGLACGDVMDSILIPSAVEEGVFGIPGIERDADVILDDLIGRHFRQIEVGIPILVVAGVGVIMQICGTPRPLIGRFVIERPAVLVSRAEGVPIFLQAGENPDRAGVAELDARVPHRRRGAAIAGDNRVVRNVPGIGKSRQDGGRKDDQQGEGREEKLARSARNRTNTAAECRGYSVSVKASLQRSSRLTLLRRDRGGAAIC